MPYHNMKEANYDDDQAKSWVADQHNNEGSPETYNFLVDDLGYTEDSLASDNNKTSNPNHEQYEDKKKCLWVRDISSSCAMNVWKAHAYKEPGDCSITSSGGDSENAGAWWDTGFYGNYTDTYTTPVYEIKIQGSCPSGTPSNTESTHWSSGTSGTGYILKDNLDYLVHSSGLDLIDSCSNSAGLIQTHAAQDGKGGAACP